MSGKRIRFSEYNLLPETRRRSRTAGRNTDSLPEVPVDLVEIAATPVAVIPTTDPSDFFNTARADTPQRLTAGDAPSAISRRCSSCRGLGHYKSTCPILDFTGHRHEDLFDVCGILG